MATPTGKKTPRKAVEASVVRTKAAPAALGGRGAASPPKPARPKAVEALPMPEAGLVASGFQAVSTLREDARGRITLTGSGRPHKPDAYKQYVNAHGEILLVPVKEIPERELWLWQSPQAMAAVQQGLAESALGLATPLSLDDLD